MLAIVALAAATPSPSPTSDASCTGVVGCTLQGIGDAVNGVGGAVNAATGAVSFFSDPLGNTYKALNDAVVGLTRGLFPAMGKLVTPDLSAGWFVHAYAVSFAAAILVMALIIMTMTVHVARGEVAGRDMADSLGFYGPVFMVGAAFGPVIGGQIVKLIGATNSDIIRWGFGTATGAMVKNMVAIWGDANPAQLAGGVLVAIVLLLLGLVALLMTVAMQVVLLVLVYLGGVVFPLGLVWLIDPTRRKMGSRLMWGILAVLLSQPLLFFLMGTVMQFVASGMGAFDLGSDFSMKNLVTLGAAIVAMFIAALSPLLLGRFAPIIPTAAPAVAMGHVGKAHQWGPDSLNEPTRRAAPEAFRDSGSAGTDAARAVPGPTPASAEGGSGGLGAATEAAATPAAPAAAGAGAAGSAGAASGAAAGAGAGAGAAAGAGGAATAATAGGAAASSTGVGAAVGIPLMAAGAAMTAAEKTVRITKAAGDAATDAAEQAHGAGSD